MLMVVKLMGAVTALGEVWLFGVFTAHPGNLIGVLVILAVIAWLLSPLLALVLVALGKGFQTAQKVTLLISSVLSAIVAVGFLGPWVGPLSASQDGSEAFVLSVLQWVVVLAGLMAVRVLNRRRRVDPART